MRVKVTVPLVIEGVYVALRVVAFGEKVPDGADQVPVVIPPVIEPARVIVPPAHTVWSISALVVTPELTVTTIWSLVAGHGPAGSSLVRVKVTVPLVIEGV